MTDKIILAGNPNVGKSTLFNRLTGLRQHTGNWAGKTVGSAYGYAEIDGKKKMIIDTPGTYSLSAASPDEALARDTICSEDCDCIVVVCDGCCLERSLFLALQIMERRGNVIICVNLMDEAAKKGIIIDFDMLSRRLGCPVIGISAARGNKLEALTQLLSSSPFHTLSEKKTATPSDNTALKLRAADICRGAVAQPSPTANSIDKVLSHRILAWPIMLCMLLFILWLSISAANMPSELLSRLFAYLGGHIRSAFEAIHAPPFLSGAMIDGVYNTATWVVAVMLPPMAIFFPLFTLLEDLGFLPRIAFNMDCVFRKCGGCGKQALTMCMGLGCNAVGVTGCRIIASRREKLIAILTNSLMPCNGRFPTIILLSALLMSGGGSLSSALAVLGVILLGAATTFISSKVLASCLLRGEDAPFILELPPFRRPKIAETLLRSLLDRTLYVLLRALKAAAPAGLLIWLLANISPSGQSLLQILRDILEPAGKFFGLDGAIMLGFILGLPANEIVLPVIMLCYLSGGSLSELPPVAELAPFLAEMGWTASTLLCVMVFTLLHWPCATTLMTIKKESGSLVYTALAAALPTVWGLGLCLVIRLLA